MAGIFDLSKVAGSNTSLINIGTIAAPGDVDDAIRNLASYLAKWRDDVGCGPVTGGSANAQTLTSNSVLVSGTFGDGVLLGFTAGFTNTGAMTLAPDGLGSVDVKKYGPTGLVALTGGEVQAGGKYLIAGQSSNADFILLNPTTRAAWELIGDTTASGATVVDFTGLSAYRMIRAKFNTLAVSTDGTQVYLRVMNSGVVLSASNTYFSELIIQDSAGVARQGSSGAATAWTLLPIIGGAADEEAGGEITISSFNQNDKGMAWWHFSSIGTSGELQQFIGSGLTTASARDGIRVVCLAGTFNGRIIVEGLR